MQGVSPIESTLAENADAMGVDADHFDSFASLAQSIPPDYSSYVYGQMMMHVAHDLCGVPIITYDDMMIDSKKAIRTLDHCTWCWRRRCCRWVGV